MLRSRGATENVYYLLKLMHMSANGKIRFLEAKCQYWLGTTVLNGQAEEKFGLFNLEIIHFILKVNLLIIIDGKANKMNNIYISSNTW